MTEETLCWFNRFHPTKSSCQQPGIWRHRTSLNTILKNARWCSEHKHDDDIRVVPEFLND